MQNILFKLESSPRYMPSCLPMMKTTRTYLLQKIKEEKHLIKEGLPHGGNLLLQGTASHSQESGLKSTIRSGPN